MRAIVLRDGQITFEGSYPVPSAAAGEILVRVVRAGICETDLQLVRGYMGFAGVPGHEFVGVAESGALAGRRVVGEINCGCRLCEECRVSGPRHCPHRTVLGILGRDGAFAEYLRLPSENLHLVPDHVSDEEAVFVEPLAAAFQIIEQVPVSRGNRAVVLGDGRLGNLCAQVLADHGAAVLAVGKHASKLRLLSDRGVPFALVEEVETDLKRGRFPRADLVIEATGSPTGLPLALRVVRPQGTVILKTTIAGGHSTPLAPVVIDEVTLLGSRCGRFEPALRALAERRVEVLPLLSDVRPLEEAREALAEAARPGALKIQLVI